MFVLSDPQYGTVVMLEDGDSDAGAIAFFCEDNGAMIETKDEDRFIVQLPGQSCVATLSMDDLTNRLPRQVN